MTLLRRTLVPAAALIAAVLLLLPSARDARAAGDVSTCDEPSLLAAIAGGGLVTFSCSGAITLTAPIVLGPGDSLILDGAGQAAIIDGSGLLIAFDVDDATLDLRDIEVIGGGDYGVRADNGSELRISDSLIRDARLGNILIIVSTLQLLDSTIQGSQVSNGISGVAINGFIRRSTVRNNAQGGLFTNVSGTLTVEDSTFTGNGGVGLTVGGSTPGSFVTIIRSTFAFNGLNGVRLAEGPISGLIINSTIYDNDAAGLWNRTNATVVNSTIAANGVGLEHFGPTAFTSLFNVIIADNTDGSCDASAVAGDGNLIEDGGCGFAAGGDPDLGPLQDNGGLTETAAITPDSAAFNVGVPYYCSAGLPVAVGAGGEDQRGAPRDTCSAGAFEPGEADPPTATILYERRQGPRWVPYTPGTWSQTPVRAVLTCEDDDSGVFDVLRRQVIQFRASTMETFVPAESALRDCEDRARNVNDLSSLPPVEIMVDLQNPVCVAKPSNRQVAPVGGNVLLGFDLELSDNFSLDSVSLVGATNSEGSAAAANAGSLTLAAPNPDTETFQRVAATVAPRAVKTGLQRTYRYTFEVEDVAGRTGQCQFTVKVK